MIIELSNYRTCIWGGLRAAPDWIQELVDDEVAFVKLHNLMIKYKNGYVSAEPGDIIIQKDEDDYHVIPLRYYKNYSV